MKLGLKSLSKNQVEDQWGRVVKRRVTTKVEFNNP